MNASKQLNYCEYTVTAANTGVYDFRHSNKAVTLVWITAHSSS